MPGIKNEATRPRVDDSEPDRPFTIREIVKIVAGCIGGLLEEVPAVLVRRAVAAYLVTVEGGDAPEDAPLGPWVSALGGVIGVAVQSSHRDDVVGALKWVLDHWSDLTGESATAEERWQSGQPVTPDEFARLLQTFPAEPGQDADASQDGDQDARVQFARDLLSAHQRATGSQSATRELLIEVGIRPECVDMYPLVGALIGGIMGTLVDERCSVANLERAVIGGNYAVLHDLPISVEHREQLVRILDFGRAQLLTLCRPGTATTVMSTIVAIFVRTVGALGMVSEQVQH